MNEAKEIAKENKFIKVVYLLRSVEAYAPHIFSHEGCAFICPLHAVFMTKKESLARMEWTHKRNNK